MFQWMLTTKFIYPVYEIDTTVSTKPYFSIRKTSGGPNDIIPEWKLFTQYTAYFLKTPSNYPFPGIIFQTTPQSADSVRDPLPILTRLSTECKKLLTTQDARFPESSSLPHGAALITNIRSTFLFYFFLHNHCCK